MAQPLPDAIAPMLATPGTPPTGAGWAWEVKWDGFRGIARIADDRMVIDSRSGRPLLQNYPELADLPTAVRGRRMVLDGELVVLDAGGRPSFELLQQRLRPQPTRTVLTGMPVIYLVFDLLVLDERSLLREPYRRRRDLLAEIELGHRHVQVSPSWDAAERDAVLAMTRERGLEGVVVKRADSAYQPGRRSRDWIKYPFRHTTEVVVGGWSPGKGRRTDSVGALLVGAYDGADLVYLGKVGTGFTDATLAELHTRLTGLARSDSPFRTPVPREDARDAHWVTPVIVGDVEYRQLTAEGRLRQAAWRGVRIDREPADVVVPATN